MKTREIKRKRKEKSQIFKKNIPTEHRITREEAQALIQSQVKVSQSVANTPAEPSLSSVRRRKKHEITRFFDRNSN